MFPNKIIFIDVMAVLPQSL